MRVVDLYCGCGGLSLGFAKAGMEVVAAFDNWTDALAVYRNNFRHPRSYVRRGIFSTSEPSATIRGVNRPMPKGYKLHPGDPVDSLEGIRPLTSRERSMIQTFPEDFSFEGTKTNIEQMIGNAVPVNLGTFVADAIFRYSGAKRIDNTADLTFVRSRQLSFY